MSYGFGSWDSSGNWNNFGIRPISVLGIIELSLGQTGSWGFSPPSGYTFDYEFTGTEVSYNSNKRYVSTSGNNVVVSNNQGGMVIPVTAGYLTVYIRRI